MDEQSYLRRECTPKNEHQNRLKKLKKQILSSSSSQLSNVSISLKCETNPKEILSDPPSSCVDRQTEKLVDKVGLDQMIREPEADVERIQDTCQTDAVRGCHVHERAQAVSPSNLEVKPGEQERRHSIVGQFQTPSVDSGQPPRGAVELCINAAGRPDSGDRIETSANHAEPWSKSSNILKSEKSKGSKLRKATKAILSLKRATSSLTSHHGDNSNVDQSRTFRGFTYSKSLVSSLWRQNAAGNSTGTRLARPNSANSFNNCAQSADSSTCQDGGTQFGLAQDTQHRPHLDQESSSSSTFPLPQFIVPKMNALKLPIVCLIKSLDGELMREIFIHRYEVGQYLINNLKVSLAIEDTKYLGLKMAKSIDEQEDVRQPWLDLNESVYKQISKHSKSISLADSSPQQSLPSTTKSVDFYLRIKFYPPNLARIQEPFLRKYLWLQLRRDLRLGKLTSSMNNLTFLMACALQFELDDFKPEYVGEKLPELNVLPNQDMIEQQAIEIWRTQLVGCKKHQIQMQFLRASVILETYGFDYYPVRDHQRQRAYLLGFNYAGVKTIRNGRIVHHFRWTSLSKISHERRMIIFHIYPTENSKRKQILGFKCLSNEDCSNLYMRLQEQKYFFTVELTYFDKSMRRPSHLTESILDQKDQQELWNRTPGPADNLDTYEDDLDESADTRDALSEQPLRSQDGHYFRPVQSSQTSSQMAEQAVQQCESPLACASGRPAFDGHDCASCRRDHQMQPRHQHSNNQSMDSSLSSHPMSFSSASTTPIIRDAHLMKSCSLQESTTCRVRDTYNYPAARANFANRSSFPDTHMERLECCVSSDCGASRIASSNMTNEQPDSNVPHLQRQSSMRKCSPNFGMINEGGREQDGAGVEMGAQEAFKVGECMASWTEQVLTQPARIFSCENWSIQQREIQQQGNRQSCPSHQSSDGSLVMQALFFCLLILALDLALRMSDSISNALEGLLAFHSTGQEATSHPSAGCSSLNEFGSLV